MASKSGIKKSFGFEAWFFVIVVLLAASLFFLVMNKAWGEIKDPLNEGLSSSMPADSSVNITRTLEQTSGGGRLFDKLVPFLIIGLFAFVLIMAGAIMKHPVMIFVGIIILGVLITVAVVYSNVYGEISSSSSFTSTSNDLPIQEKFMHYLPWVIFIAAIGIVGIMIYSRGSGGTVGL